MTANPHANKDDAVAVELRLDRLARLYNSLDPSPFNEKELDAAAEDLGGKPMRLVILLSEPELAQTRTADITESIHNHFAWREQVERKRLHSELRRGRSSLLIGLAFLVTCLVVRELPQIPETPVGRMLRESLLIVGWVAMWGPLDIFLYGWWPIVGRRRLFDRLSRVDVEVRPLK